MEPTKANSPDPPGVRPPEAAGGRGAPGVDAGGGAPRQLNIGSIRPDSDAYVGNTPTHNFYYNAPTQPDFTTPVPPPALPQAEYIVSNCQYAVPRFSNKVAP